MYGKLSSLIEIFRQRASDMPGKVLYRFLGEDGREEALSYVELDHAAKTLAANLQQICRPGDRALLLFHPGLEYIKSLFGCFYAGIVAVPVYPPTNRRNSERINLIANDAGISVALTGSGLSGKMRQFFDVPAWLVTDEHLPVAAADYSEYRCPDGSLAFLQYTSGSTGSPKGVMLNHTNLFHNAKMGAHAFGFTESSIVVSWLPPYHDMGLIGTILEPLLEPAEVILMSPVAFVQRPYRWLKAISDYRATISGGPNFAYDLCVQKIGEEQKQSLDLSSWQVAFNGAEPVRRETLDAFVAAFGQCGFKRKAFHPCYGLAETTLIVTGGNIDTDPRIRKLDADALERHDVVLADSGTVRSLEYVACGCPQLEQTVLIVDPQTREPCPPDRIGEIWVSGEHIAQGYWNRPEDTEEIFHAYPKVQAGEASGGPFLRTGDLGFMQRGELFITGRLKDLIILNGRNLYPQDIERCAQACHPSLRPNANAAFSHLVDGVEELILVQELDFRQKPDPEEVFSAIRKAIGDECQTSPYAIALVRPGAVPKTSSGKIRRRECKKLYIEGELETVAEWNRLAGAVEAQDEPMVARPGARELEIRQWLSAHLAAKLGVDVSGIDPRSTFLGLGLNSIDAIEITAELETWLGQRVSPMLVWDYPSIAELASYLAGRQIESESDTSPLRAIDIEELEPAGCLSHAQRRLWFVCQYQKEYETVYNIPVALRLSGAADVPALKKSLQAIADRHGSLRTRFEMRGDEPVQIVERELEIELRVTEVEENRIGFCIEQHAKHVFNLAVAPLWKVDLLRITPRDHVLLLNMHHIIADGWSMNVLMRELSAFYSAFLRDEPCGIEPLPLQYTDYALWQHENVREDDLRRQIEYWRKYLTGAPPLLELPSDRPRPAQQSFKGAVEHFTIDIDLSGRVRRFAVRSDTTLFMVLFAAFNLLLSRHSNQRDLVVGAPIAGRNRPELTDLIGFFVNVLALRTRVDWGAGFSTLLAQVRQNCLQAYRNQDVSFETLVEVLQPKRSLSYHPLYQVAFALQDANAGRLKLEGLKPVPMEAVTFTSKQDLFMQCWEDGERLVGSVEYSTDLFESSTVRGLIGRFQKLLQVVIEQPELRVGDIALISQREYEQCFKGWNKTASEYARDCVHRLFERQVVKSPHATALHFNGQTVSYEELNSRSNRLAHYMIERGVGPEIAVGVCLPRSFEMLVSLLAVLKAGGCYVPIDASYPAARIRYMIDDGGIRFVIAHKQRMEQIAAAGIAVQIVCPEENAGKISGYPTENPSVPVTPLNLAYVIYTSGSTGRPKGTLLNHLGACNLAAAQQRIFNVSVGSRVMQFASLGFDAATWEWLMALLQGGALCLATEENIRPGPELASTLRENRADHITLPPSALAVLDPRELPDLRTVVVAGEACPPGLAEKWLERNFMNAYGPTETTVCATVAVCNPENLPPSIGCPISNTRVYILDEGLNLLPPGIAGELCIAGDSVARGYHRCPGLTAERFIPDPFANEPGQRLYRTGDLARYRSNGNIEFLGRLDHQVKLRGYRIELGEIEQALREQPDVLDAVTVIHRRSNGESSIAAYLVPDRKSFTSQDDLQGQVSMWQSLYDEDVYRDRKAEDPLTNFNGWVSSYSGKQYPLKQMQAWAAQTVRRISALRTDSILEIGCGQGLFLFRLLPLCRSYTATDFSHNALDYIDEKLAVRRNEAEVRLLCREAVNFEGFSDRNYDTVVLNSVVQYFPGVQYLEEVIENALRVVKPDGAVFIGDVRNFDLMSAFHASVVLYRSEPDLLLDSVRQALYQQQLNENELLLSPDFFLQLQDRYPQIRAVEILPKHDNASLREENELFKYRYDVILHLGEQGGQPHEPDQLDWWRDNITLELLEQRLVADKPLCLLLENIPDVRISKDLAAVELLYSTPAGTVGELKNLSAQDEASALSIDAIIESAGRCGYHAVPSLIGCHAGHYTLVLTRDSAEFKQRKLSYPGDRRRRTGRDLANNPLQGQLAAFLIPRVREHLKERLPDYMLPAFFVMLDRLPLTASGKVDRKALPVPDAAAGVRQAYVPPRNDIEAGLILLWSELLAVDADSLGVEDNFFDVGGHSLLAVKLQKSINDRFHVPVSVADIFEQPSIAALAVVIERRLASSDQYEKIPRLPQQGGYELSASQLRLWLTYRMDSASSAHHSLEVVHLPERWSRPQIEDALYVLVERHESLRTVFRQHQGEPWQHILPPFRITLDERRIDGDAALQPLLNEYAHECFDLSKGPLLRVALVETKDGGGQYLLWCMHEIIADGSSAIILRDEFRRLMEASTDTVLPALDIQYRDFAAWQNRLLSEDDSVSRNYWHERLGGRLPRLDLPFDYPQTADTHIGGASYTFSIPSATRKLMESMARRHQATPFVILQTALSVFLYRLSGQRDIILAVPVSGRQHPDVERVVGFFLNTLLLRHRLNGNESFAGLLEQVKQNTLQGLSHQHYPFERLLDELNVRRVPNGFPVTPIVLNMLTFMSVDSSDLLQSHIHYNKTDLQNNLHTYYDTKVELEIYVVEHDDELSFRVHYRTALFRAETIEYLMREFAGLLRQTLNEPGLPLHCYRMFDEEHVYKGRHYPGALQSAWLDFQRSLEQPLSYTHVLEGVYRQVVRRSQATALQQGERSVNYGQLWRRIGALSAKLHGAGIDAGSVVGLLVDDPLERIVGMMAVMHAGGTVTPFSADEPLQRQQRMRALVEPAGWLITRNGIERLTALGIDEATPVVILDALAEPGPLSGNLVAWERPEPDLGHYIFFTSGSTGEPKPILGRAESLAHYIQWEIEEYGLGEETRVSQLAAPTFDASLRDIFVALCSGGTACIPPAKAAELTPDDLVEWLESAQVTVTHSVPSLFRSLHGVLTSERLPDLQQVLLAGEALLPGDVRRWWSLFEGRIGLTNLYGATETTLVKCYHRIGEADLEQDHVSIGRPMPGCVAIILDDRGEICPRGETGELHIRTPYATHGYYRQPEKTTEIFISNPWGNSEERIYKTGDLAQQRADGRLKLLGRRDQQIKIRGVRVEPGEIENRLQQQPGVALAAVIAVDLGEGELQLQAHLEAEAGRRPDVEAIREDLKRNLPPAFMPGRIEVHMRLPRTATGKVDRNALQKLQQTGLSSQPAHEGPRTETEERLAQIWREVLKVEQVGRHADFFELGGHSLKALLVVSRARKVFGVDVDLADLFGKTVLADLANHIDEVRGRKRFSGMERAEGGEFYPVTSAQRRLWVLHQIEEYNSAHHVPAVLELKKEWSRDLLESVITAMVQRHEPLRTVFVSRDDEIFQRVLPAQDFQLSEGGVESESELSALMTQCTREPFNLQTGPLFRARLVHTWDGRRLMIWCMHEIIADGSSSVILQNEFVQLLQSQVSGEAGGLPPLPVQYKDYAIWQNRQLQTATHESREYWHRHLQGYRHWLDLPYDFPITADSGRSAALYEYIAPGSLQRQLSELSQSRQVTLFMLMQAALSVLLMRVCRQQDIVLAVPVSGREHPDVEKMVGFFLNTILLRQHVNPDAAFTDFLNSVKQTTLRGLAHQNYPFERLLEELDLPREPNRFPVTPVLLNVLNFMQAGALHDQRAFREKAGDADTAEGRGLHRSIDREAKVELELYVVEHTDALRLRCLYRSDLFKPETVENLLSGFVSLLQQIARFPEKNLYAYTLDDLTAARAASPQSVATRSKAANKPYAEPEGNVEKRLATIWAEVLSVERVGRYDDFFAAGGHSLKALLVISRVRKAFEVQIHPRMLFESPILADFARRVGEARQQEFVPIEAVEEQQRYPASAAQFSLWLQHELSPQSIAYNVAAVIEIPPEWETEAVCWVLRQLVARHEPLRTVFEREDDLLYQRILPPFEVDLDHEYVNGDEELKALLLKHSRKPFDLRNGPLFRAGLSTVSDGRRFLLWCMHEIIADGSSTMILRREIQQLLDDHRNGGTGSLPALRIQYKDFAVWQNHLLHQPNDPACRFWREQLHSPPGWLELPFDRPLTAQTGRQGAVYECPAPVELKRQLEQFAQSRQVTLFMVLQAALSTLLMRLTCSQDIVLAAPVSGREHPDVQNIIGFFLNTLLLRHRPAAELKFEDFLQQVKETTLKSLGYQYYPFERLVDELELPRAPNRFPVTPVMLNMLNFLEDEGTAETRLIQGVAHHAIDGQQRRHYELDRHAKVELEIYVIERRDGIRMRFQYRSALFEPETIEELADELLRLLSQVAAAPGKTLAEYNISIEESWRVHRAVPVNASFLVPESLYETPQGDVERQLAAVWSEILKLERIGRHDDFFALGGHSLKALLMISRVRKMFSIQLSPGLLFESPTLAAFARMVERARKQEFPPIAAVEEWDRYPASAAQFSLWLEHALNPQSAAYHIAAMIELTPEWETGALRWVIGRLIARHESLRTIFEQDEGELFQRILPPFEVELDEIWLDDDAELEGVRIRHSREPFDLSRSPLFRAWLVNISDGRRLLLWCMHEIIADGSSTVILQREIFHLFESYCNDDRETSLPALRVQYKDFAVWQKRQLSWSGNPARRYWHGQLQASVGRLDLPFDYPLTPQTGKQSATYTCNAPAGLKQKLDLMAKEKQVTLFMLLQAALSTLFMRLTGQQDIILAVPVSGREHPDVQNVVGFFLNTILLRHYPESGQHFSDFLHKVRETTLQGLEQQHYPFERLLTELDLPNEPYMFPVTPVMLNMLNFLEVEQTPLAGPGSGNRLYRDNKVEFELDVLETKNDLRFRVHYRKALFKNQTVEYLMGELLQLLEQVVVDSDKSLGAYDLFGQCELSGEIYPEALNSPYLDFVSDF